jgi:hypothetical protein
VDECFSMSSFVFPPMISIIVPLLHAHLSPPPEMCDRPDQAARYHILGL